MQQSLHALELIDEAMPFPVAKLTIKNLRERLAQPNDFNPDWDAMAVMVEEQQRKAKRIAELEAQPEHDYRTRYARGCYKCGSHYCPANCPEPAHLVLQQPQMQPCAGRNCGSTNPNLHSAECFEDYEKSTGVAQPEQEPVAWVGPSWMNPETRTWENESFAPGPINGWIPLYTAPPQRTWVGLTDEEINNSYMFWIVDQQDIIGFGKSIETKLRKKNT